MWGGGGKKCAISLVLINAALAVLNYASSSFVENNDNALLINKEYLLILFVVMFLAQGLLPVG